MAFFVLIICVRQTDAQRSDPLGWIDEFELHVVAVALQVDGNGFPFLVMFIMLVFIMLIMLVFIMFIMLVLVMLIVLIFVMLIVRMAVPVAWNAVIGFISCIAEAQAVFGREEPAATH